MVSKLEVKIYKWSILFSYIYMKGKELKERKKKQFERKVIYKTADVQKLDFFVFSITWQNEYLNQVRQINFPYSFFILFYNIIIFFFCFIFYWKAKLNFEIKLFLLFICFFHSFYFSSFSEKARLPIFVSDKGGKKNWLISTIYISIYIYHNICIK